MAVLSTTIQHQLVWTRSNEAEFNRLRENRQMLRQVSPTQHEMPMNGETLSAGVVPARGIQRKPAAPTFDIPSSRHTSMWARGMAANKQTDDIENQLSDDVALEEFVGSPNAFQVRT
jgi:hypothetical protein